MFLHVRKDRKRRERGRLLLADLAKKEGKKGKEAKGKNWLRKEKRKRNESKWR